MQKEICDYCTGCGVCSLSCPRQAIKIIKNERKELVAQIDSSACISCGVCEKICPQRRKLELHSPIKAYAAWTKDENDYSTTSSGGIGTALCKQILLEEGVVYGAAWVEPCKLEHIRVTDLLSLEKIKGSKYVQSNIMPVLPQIRSDLQQKKKVLVICTPCQAAAVQSFLSTDQKESLILVDIICHGVPPIDFLSSYISEKIADLNNISDITFRKKNYVLSVYQGENLVYSKNINGDLYLQSFMKGMSFRENCYYCHYSKSQRITDITIGDFWGLDTKSCKLKMPDFVSCVLINTKIGNDIFDSIKKDVFSEERNIEEVINGNRNLQVPSAKHKDRELFLRNIIRGNTFTYAVKKTSINREMIIAKLITIIKYPLRKIKRIIVRK